MTVLENSMKRQIVITGGAGFIGVNLALDALKKNYEVVVFDNLSRRGTNLNLQALQEHSGLIFVQGDVRDRPAVEDLVRRYTDAEAFFHLAGQVAVTSSISNPHEDFFVNAVGSFNLLEALREIEYKGLALYASTNKVYGKLENVDLEERETCYEFRDMPAGISERYPLDFHSPYGCSKGAADQYFLDYGRIYGLSTVVFRQSCVYGTHQFGIEDQGWVAWFTIASLFDNEITIFGDGKQVRDVLFADDLVTAYWQALAKKHQISGQAFNIGGGVYRLSLIELIDYLQRSLKKKIRYRFATPRAGDQKVYVSDTRKAQRLLDWSPSIRVEEGVERLVDWAIENQEKFADVGVIYS